ncbi:MAG: DUF2442 domain-containing protein [bacterium]|nr:DUF2442 domain-containing protein [bacterium]
MNEYPKIKSVKIVEDMKLEILFADGTQKTYDCKPILLEEPFTKLQDTALFMQVHVDEGGYGISWNDQIDLSESELWINGK